ncbi:D-alanyl-D-alanine carboxypeptidase/D-alanyl-D-alanine-endopeptidase [Blastococcus sp. Marseille-P5729]|uniref:D-alanyl-D-alanine carboxypeptidase/D-alanyl-D-alanine endopeptidase n=1 Tax=Blastococcus sp. Marseille-P5729 TaxID=2086582 RepID=UPI00131AF61B|nr:D-alanyl-D-alanine carboxypeptidase/D-alanyl-D-alanine-endopeptidase [Blastococcus sp. Marseille-P5729]
MAETDPRGPIRGWAPVRALGSAGAVLLAAVVGVGGVVGIAALAGPTNSDSAADGGGSQATPTVSLPANPAPPEVLAGLDANAPTPTAAGIQQALAVPMSDPVLGTLAAQVIDPGSGITLLEQGAQTAMQPGSTMKLYTAAAAASVLEPGMRITTSVVRGTNPTEITIVAGGDPTLSSQPTSTYNPGAATIAQLAEQLTAAGVTQVTKVTVDNSVFEGPATAEGWGSGDAPSTYAAPIYPVMVDGGRTDPADDRSMRHGDPDLETARQLAAALGSPGAVVERGVADPTATQVASVQSAPIEQLIEQMIVHSDNVLAECIGRLVARELGQPATFQGAVAAVTSTMTQLGVDLTGFAGYDASGLSQLNTTSAGSIGSLMSIVSSGQHPTLDVVDSALAVAGYSGTLSTRYEAGSATEGAGRVRGKTGTLTGVSSLAGTVLTSDGRILVFSFISNGGGDTTAVRAALDEIAATLAACGCR